MVRFEIVELGPAGQKIVMTGRLDATSVGTIETGLTAAVAAGGKNVVIDLTALEFISSLGIRLLLSATRPLGRRGLKLAMFGAQPMVADVLEAMALGEILPLVATEDEALARIAG
jgi:anti-anti-sigma factor